MVLIDSRIDKNYDKTRRKKEKIGSLNRWRSDIISQEDHLNNDELIEMSNNSGDELIDMYKDCDWNDDELMEMKEDYDLKDDDSVEMYKDYDLYVAARDGDLHSFKTVLSRVSKAGFSTSIDILSRLSPNGNTFLHVAAKFGNKDIVTFISDMKPSLVLAKNYNGETALHLAAKAGDESMVKAAVQIQNAGDENNLLMSKNDKGNTALHEALSSGHSSIAEYLIQEDPEISYHTNNEGESVLYLAAKAGFSGCVILILQLCTDEERLDKLFKKKSPIRAAIKKKHTDVLKAIFNANPRFIQLRDRKGRNPLHMVASLGYLEEARYLLKEHPPNATRKDKTGSLPIHLASTEGHVDIISLLLQGFPDPGELLDRDGRNILHLAAKSGRFNAITSLLNNHNHDIEYLKLINMKDKYGNTPLHLATMYWHPQIVNALTWVKGVDINAANKRRMSALDVAEQSMPHNHQFRERLTWAVLKAAGATQCLPHKVIMSRERRVNIGKYKERVNTLLLVATLVATVTFAAGFTMPGGNNSSDSNLGMGMGMATMVRDKGFHVFVFCNIIAMYSSIAVAVALIWAQLGDLRLIHTALVVAVPLLGIALATMSMAFTAGVFVVVSELRWLSTTIFAMAVSFLLILFLFILPLFTPLTTTNKILRCLSYYPLCFLMLITSTT